MIGFSAISSCRMSKNGSNTDFTPRVGCSGCSRSQLKGIGQLIMWNFHRGRSAGFNFHIINTTMLLRHKRVHPLHPA